MKSKICALITAAVFACTLTLTSAAQEKQEKKEKPAVAKKEAMEQHPQIAGAMQHLREAKENLEHAAHDFGGHRAAALKHVNEALEECRQALAYDKK